ncbi:MAG: BrnT family toxin [Novosphingobium sp.]
MKDEANKRKHGLPLDLGAQVFDHDFIEEQDTRYNYGEARFVAMGPVVALAGRICVVVYTWRDAKRRLISFRKANEEEITRYRTSHP